MYNQDTFSGPSFSLRNRIGRVLWNVVYLFFFRYSPTPMYRYRSFLLRLFGAKIGRGVHVYPGVKIWAPWNLTINGESGIGDNVIIYSQGEIKIGYRVVISQRAHLIAGTHDYTVPGFPLITKPIIVNDHVWIAAEAFIHPGITIGEGCVIAARAVVTKDMPAWMVCAGHPCEPIKQRPNFKKIASTH
jgi:putative colanic acid biosynthesis acetyltransferase WcaF